MKSQENLLNSPISLEPLRQIETVVLPESDGLINRLNDDLVIVESETNEEGPEGIVVAIQPQEGELSPLRYEAPNLDPETNQYYFEIDFSDYGIEPGTTINTIQLGNLLPQDLVDGENGQGFLSEEGFTPTDNEGNPFSINQFTPEIISLSATDSSESAIAEFGSFSTSNEPFTLELTNTYKNPVVFLQVASNNESDPVVARLVEVNSDNFTAFLQEPSNLDGQHDNEQINYLVAEAGTWQLPDGTILEITTIESDGSTFEEDLNFAQPFPTTPIAISQIQTFNNETFLDTRQDNTSPLSFELGIEQEETLQSEPLPNPETLGYLAIAPGEGTFDLEGNGYLSDLLVIDDQTTVESNFETSTSFTTLEFEDPDPASTRVINETQILIQEDTSADPETDHNLDLANLLILEGNSGQINAITGGPTLTNGQSFSIPESSPDGTTVGTIEVTDPDTNPNEINFEITHGNPDLDEDNVPAFSINNTGTITVTDADELTNTPTFELEVTASDGNLSDRTNISIEVIPENPLPEPTSISLIATAFGDTNPPLIKAPLDGTNTPTLQNGDFLITRTDSDFPSDIILGDGLNEFTFWSFDLTENPNFSTITNLDPTSINITQAILNLTLTTTRAGDKGLETDTLNLLDSAISIFNPEQPNEDQIIHKFSIPEDLPANSTIPGPGETGTISIDLLNPSGGTQTDLEDELITALFNSDPGSLAFQWQDDALIFDAQLTLDLEIPGTNTDTLADPFANLTGQSTNPLAIEESSLV